MSNGDSKKLRVGIVGASTLRGKEIKSVLAERKVPVEKLVLLDRFEDVGRLAEYEGEPVISSAIDENSFDLLDVVFFAADPETTRKFAPLAAQKNLLVLDLSCAFSQQVHVPLFLDGLIQSTGTIQPRPGILSLPHPAAIALTLVLKRMSAAVVLKKTVVTILEPVSERGGSGVEELEKQTLHIFSFQQLPREVFDQQIAFNLLSQLGREAHEQLREVEEIICRQLGQLLGQSCPLPSINLLQAPVFHGHAFSIYFELESPAEITRLEEVLISDHIEVSASLEEPPTPVQVAGADKVQVGGLKKDLARAGGFWAWAVSDNLRLSALNAVAAVERIFPASKPS